jgi:sugar lactone lactonase YvrE
VVWTFEKIAGPFQGPAGGLAWDGSGMLFSAIAEGRILRYDPATGKTGEFRKYTNRTNGLAFAPDGALYGCQESSRRVVHFAADGSTSTTGFLLEGLYHNQPNNLAIDSKGRIWFSDPQSELRASGPQIFPPLAHASVLRLELDSLRKLWGIRRITYDTIAPRAVALSPNEATLYVAETDNAPTGRRELRAYAILPDDTLGPFTVLHAFGRDYRGEHRGIEGMCTDSEGNIVACSGWRKSGPGPLVCVFSPGGAILESHPVPSDQPMNCAFGDADLASLYVTTAGGELLRARNCGRRGCVLPTAKSHRRAQ